MMRILFLSTWFPYPPNQGSKIRAYHLLAGLTGKHEVGLISFQDGDLPQVWIKPIREQCAFVEVVPRQPFAQNRWKALVGWLSTKPRAIYAGYSKEFAERVREKVQHWEPHLIVALTFVTAPYVFEVHGIPRVLDVDILVGQMLQEEYHQEQKVIERIRKFIAAWKFERYESKLYRDFDLCLVTSKRDLASARELIGDPNGRVSYVPNGVDLEYFRPDMYAVDEGSLIFHGALTYSANYDAMEYFLDCIFPSICARRSDVKLWITGSTEGVDLNSLRISPQVSLTGYVDDIREVLGRAQVCVVPLRKGAGTRLKILEAMAMGIPVISTTKGAEGLDLQPDRHVLIADEPSEFVSKTVELLANPEMRSEIALNARQLVQQFYSWPSIQKEYELMVTNVVQGKRYG